MDNKYVNRSRISEAKFRELVRLFALDLTATQMAELTNLNRNTVNRYVNEIRKRLAEYCEIMSPVIDQPCCSVEIPRNELRYLGIVEKNGVVCLRPWEKDERDKKGPEFQCTGSLTPDLIIDLKKEEYHWKESRSYLQKKERSKLSRIDGFLGYTQSRMEKFKGIHNQTYFLHLKESEFRYNNDKDKLYKLILKIIRKNPLF